MGKKSASKTDIQRTPAVGVLSREDAAVRLDLLDAAKEILDREGVPTLTVGHIAEKAGVTPKDFFAHFRDMDEFLADLVGDYVDYVEEQIEEMTESVRMNAIFAADDKEEGEGLLELCWFRGADWSYESLGAMLEAVATVNETVRRGLEKWYDSLSERVRTLDSRDALAIFLTVEHFSLIDRERLGVTTQSEVEKLLERLVLGC